MLPSLLEQRPASLGRLHAEFSAATALVILPLPLVTIRRLDKCIRVLKGGPLVPAVIIANERALGVLFRDEGSMGNKRRSRTNVDAVADGDEDGNWALVTGLCRLCNAPRCSFQP